MRIKLLLTIAFLLTAAPFTLADTIEVSVSSSLLVDVSSPNDNFYAYYTTAQESLARPSIGMPQEETTFSGFSLDVPEGDVITSASITVTATTIDEGGVIFAVPEGLPPPDLNSPSVAPTFGNTGTSDISVNYIDYSYAPTINGNEISTGNVNLIFFLIGNIEGTVLTPGTNWSGYIGGSAEVDIPYTMQLDATYSPVPEPSTIALLGTGILGLAGAARRKFLTR